MEAKDTVRKGMNRKQYKQTECDAHLELGEHIPAIGHCKNPDFACYNLCAECIAEFDSKPQRKSER